LAAVRSTFASATGDMPRIYAAARRSDKEKGRLFADRSPRV
jgi:hypothetical protein